MTTLKLVLIVLFVVTAAVLGTYERQLHRRGRRLGPGATRFAIVFAVLGFGLVAWIYVSPP